MVKQQRGMTTLGLLILLAFVGSVGFGVIQMVPVYLENFKIQKMLNQAKDNLSGQNTSVTEIRKSLGRTADIESLRDIDINKDFKITRNQAGFTLATDYSREKRFVANVYLLAKFSHSVEITR